MSDYAPNDNSSNTLTDKIPKVIRDEINNILGKISDKRQNKHSDKSDSNKINEVDKENNNDVILDAQKLDEDASHKAGENEHKDNLLSKSVGLSKYSKHVLNDQDGMLNSDMRDLDKIAADITTKSRLIEINNDEVQKKRYRFDRNLAFGILILILANIYLFNKYMTISLAKHVILTIILIVAYYLYITYLYNYYGLNKPQFKSPYEQVDRQQIHQDLRKIRKDDYLSKNCDCPSTLDIDDSKEKKEVADYIHRSGGHRKYGDKIKNNADDFYYDGTAPIQNKEMIFNTKYSSIHKNKNKGDSKDGQFMIEWESSNHRAGVGLNKNQLDAIGLKMEDTIEHFTKPLPAALPHPYLVPHSSSNGDSKELDCVETSSVGAIQSKSINKNKSYELDKWMTPTSDL